MGDSKSNCPIVGIGASAGGLETLQDLFIRIEFGVDCAIVVVQHLSPDFKSLMGELLDKHTKLDIVTLNKPTIPKKGTIYLCPSNKHTILDKKGMLVPMARTADEKIYYPIDLFFDSLRQQGDHRSMAIILSGTGSDGSRGIYAIKEINGMVVAQKPNTAKFDGMPKAAIQTGQVDFIGTIEEIAKQINEIYKQRRDHETMQIDSPQIKGSVESVLDLLYSRYKIDFSKYRDETLLRRLNKRQVLVKVDNLGEYYDYLCKNVQEQEVLRDDFLIGVTHFFRDKELWDKLDTQILAPLFESDKPKEIRCWVAGCSTGEEAYTLGILLNKREQKNVKWKIFATDIDPKAIKKASSGVYNENILNEVPKEHHSKFSSNIDGGYHISKSIRKQIVFAVHNLIDNAPFINMDLILCRNVLIYFKPASQQKVLKNFHFSLKKEGFMFLGPSESLGAMEKYFNKLEKRTNIFSTVGSTKTLMSSSENIARSSLDPIETSENTKKDYEDRYLIDSAEASFMNATLEEISPALVFLKPDGQIMYSQGQLSKFLFFPKGVQSEKDNILNKTDLSVGLLIKRTVEECLKSNAEIDLQDVEMVVRKKSVLANLKFKAVWVEHHSEKMVLLQFLESKSDMVNVPQTITKSDSLERKIRALELEVKETKFQLSQTHQKMETLNEELQASNEELMGANEELQSSNEELQSVNEELYTINQEYQNKITELSEANDDLNNLFEGTGVATVFLNKDLEIRKFTESVADFINLERNDIGRPIKHFQHNLNYEGFESDLNDAFKHYKSIEKTVTTHDDKRLLINIKPYKTNEERVAGLVISMTDVSQIEKNKELAEVSELKLRAIYDASHDTHFLLDKDLNILEFNRVAKESVEELYKETPQIGQSMIPYTIPGTTEDFKQKSEVVFRTGEPVYIKRRLDIAKGVVMHIDSSFLPVKDKNGKVYAVSFTAKDITEAVKAQEIQEESKNYVDRMLNSIPLMIREVEEDKMVSFNNTWSSYTGHSEAGLALSSSLPLVHESDREMVKEIYANISNQSAPEVKLSYRLWSIKGEYRHVSEYIVSFDQESRHSHLIATMDTHNEWLQHNLVSNASDFAKLCAWEFDVNNKQFKWTGNLKRLLKIKKAPSSFNDLLELMADQSEGKKLLKEKWASLWEFGEQVNLQVDITNSKNEVLNIAIFARPIDFDNEGRVTRCHGFVQDITATSATAKRLSDLQAIIDKGIDLFCVIDFDGNFIEMNAYWKTVLGYELEEMIGGQFMNFIHPEDQEKSQEEFSKVIKHKYVLQGFMNRYIKKDGSLVSLLWNTVTVPSTKKVYCIARDVSELVLAQEKISFQQTMLSNIQSAIIVTDLEGTIIYTNNNVDKVIGYTQKQLLGKTPALYYEPSPSQLVKDFERLKNGQAISSEWLLTTQEGNKHWVYTNTQPMIDEEGKIFGFIGISERIDERKQREEEFERLALVARHTENMVVISDDNRKIVWVNKAFEDRTGWKLSEIKGRAPGKFLQGRDTDLNTIRKIGEALNNREGISVEVVNYSKTNERYWVMLHIQPVEDEEGNLQGFISIQTDITNQKEIEHELIKAKEVAEDSNLKKSEFLANMSHEFRTPLNGIIGLSNLIANHKLSPEEINKMADKIFVSGNRLHETVNKALDLAKIESGKDELEYEVFNLSTVLTECTELLRPLVSLKNIELKLYGIEDEMLIYADNLRIHQVFNNLIGNAIKFTQKGYVHIRVINKQLDGVPIYLIIIQDTGIGISKEHHDLIFEPFSQVSTGYSRSYEGTGLGLSITKRIVEAHDGKIELDSGLGEGSTFKIYLSATIPQQNEKAKKI